MTCPICGKPTEARHRPFCSRRCQQIDLGRWLSGAYAIPVAEEDGAEAEDDAGSRDEPARGPTRH
ncbi:MAG: DNA gyrase inhibitor YacG [Paracoccaceae bacterium]|nr:MAG: DNA gyrase inhibitor YacG [Alphaproteobacteria bacterium]GIX13311.1 MAG: DNA gyrase inhibitor YacG [Paracoccaceae bacterium]